MRICVLDLGIGNLHSITKALRHVAGSQSVAVFGAASTSLRADSPTGIPAGIAADLVVLPGVGAFGTAAPVLARVAPAIRRSLTEGTMLFGICLGMQLLFERSAEGTGPGLALLPGEVTSLATRPLPHIGYSRVERSGQSQTLALPDVAYYAHSFRCEPTDPTTIVATTEYGADRFPAVIRCGRVVGCQFHPEKSSRAGLAFLDSLLREATP